MATIRKMASMRLQAIQAEVIAEQGQATVKPLASYFGAPGKPPRKPRVATAKPLH